MAERRLVESWTWFAVASLAFVLRCFSRAIRLGGWRNLELEDMFMALTFAFYTNVIVLVNIQDKHPFTNILPATGTAGMTRAQIDDRIYGSKLTFTIEESMIMTQWGCKTCMCLLYYKLTIGLGLQRQVKLLIARAIVTGIFSLGIFVIISAILSRYYCFAHPESIMWIFWYVREASTGVIVANVPHCYALLRKVFSLEAFGTLISSSRRTRETHDSNGVPVGTELRRTHPSKHSIRLDDGGSESTENFAAKQASSLQIWQTNEYGINESGANQEEWEKAEVQSIRRGRLGTKSTVEGSRLSSGH
ncbi:hypothetical protein V492_01899 [Pseudogymnoascus sp. VKM F-4246]|nr:hypothetical protein V492_01899 [Pseudogymnoascus sp. VKM F-4246]